MAEGTQTPLDWTLPKTKPAPLRKIPRNDDCACCYGNICKYTSYYDRAMKRSLEIENGSIPMNGEIDALNEVFSSYEDLTNAQDELFARSTRPDPRFTSFEVELMLRRDPDLKFGHPEICNDVFSYAILHPINESLVLTDFDNLKIQGDYSEFDATITLPEISLPRVTRPPKIRRKKVSKKLIPSVALPVYQIRPNKFAGSPHCYCQLCKHPATGEKVFEPKYPQPAMNINDYIHFHYETDFSRKMIKSAMNTLFRPHHLSGCSFIELYGKINMAATIASHFYDDRNNAPDSNSVLIFTEMWDTDFSLTPAVSKFGFTTGPEKLLKDFPACLNRLAKKHRLTDDWTESEILDSFNLVTARNAPQIVECQETEMFYLAALDWLSAIRAFAHVKNTQDILEYRHLLCDSTLRSILESNTLSVAHVRTLYNERQNHRHHLGRTQDNRWVYAFHETPKEHARNLAQLLLEIPRHQFNYTTPFRVRDGINHPDFKRRNDSIQPQGLIEIVKTLWDNVLGAGASTASGLIDSLSSVTSIFTDIISNVTHYVVSPLRNAGMKAIYDAFKAFLKSILGDMSFLWKTILSTLIDWFRDPLHISQIFQLINLWNCTTHTQIITSLAALAISFGTTDIYPALKSLLPAMALNRTVAEIVAFGPIPEEMDIMRLAETAFALASVFVLGKSFDSEKDKEKCATSFKEWLNQYSLAGRAFSNVVLAGKHFKDIFGFFRDLFFSASYWILGQSGVASVYMHLMQSLPDNILKWAEEVIKITDPGLKATIPVDKELRARINDLYLQSQEINLELMRSPKPFVASSMTSRLIGSITDLHAYSVSVGHSGTRIDPHCIVLYGDPGVGKSVVTTALGNFLCDKRQWPRDKTVYTVSPGSKFFDAFNPDSHKIHMIDDMSQFCAPDQDTAPMLMQAKTNAAYNTPQAVASDKGTRYYSCEYIIGSANDPFPKMTGVLRTNSAFYRRRNLLIKVGWNTAWLDSHKIQHQAGVPTVTLDVGDVLTEEEALAFEHLAFTPMHPNPPSANNSMESSCRQQSVGPTMLWPEFIKFYEENVDKYMSNQHRLLKVLDANYHRPLPKATPHSDDCGRGICQEPSCIMLRDLQPQGKSWWKKLTTTTSNATSALAIDISNVSGICNENIPPFDPEPRVGPHCRNAVLPLVSPAFMLARDIQIMRENHGFVSEVIWNGTPYPISFLRCLRLRRAGEVDTAPGPLQTAYNYVSQGILATITTPTSPPLPKTGFIFTLELPTGMDKDDRDRFIRLWNGINIPTREREDNLKYLLSIVEEDKERRRLVLGFREEISTFKEWCTGKLKFSYDKVSGFIGSNKRFLMILAIIGGLGAIGVSAYSLSKTKPQVLGALDHHHFFHEDPKNNVVQEGVSYNTQQQRLRRPHHILGEGVTYNTDQKRQRLPRIQSEALSYTPTDRRLPRISALIQPQGGESYADELPNGVINEPDDVIIPQGTSDPNALQAICGIYARNGVNIYFDYTDRNGDERAFSMSAFGIQGSTILAPQHFFDPSRLQPDMNIYVTGYNGQRIAVPYRPEHLQVVTDDTVLYWLGNRYPAFRSGIIESHLIREQDLAYFPKECPIAISGLSVDLNGLKPGRETHLGMASPIDHRHMPLDQLNSYRPTEESSERVYIRRGYVCRVISQPGDCGKILVAFNTALPRKLLGIHTFGWIKENKGGAMTITSEKVQESLLALHSRLNDVNLNHTDISFDEESGHLSDPSLPKKGTLCAFNYSETDDDTLMQVIPDGNYTILGTVDKNWTIAQSSKTELRKSAIHGMIKEPTHAPAALSKAQAPGCPSTPLAIAISKYGKNVLPFPSLDVEAAVDHTRNVLKDTLIPTYRDPVVATMDEAINGIRGPSGAIIENFRGMEMSSSAGYPHRLPARRPNNAPGKKSYFREKTDNPLEYEISDPQLLEEILDKESKAKKGLRVPSVTMDVLKDELRPIEKVHIGKTRAINVMPLPFVILFRMYFLDFKNSFCNAHGQFFGTVGTDAEGPDWTTLWNNLRNMSPTGFAGDYTNWDGTIEAGLMMEVADLITDWYGDKHGRIRRVLMHEIIHTVHLAQNTLYMKHQGNPSGCPLTVELNCICNFLYACLVWRISCRRAGRLDLMPLHRFKEHVVNYNYGDDNIFAVAPEVDSIFNQNTFASILGEHGIIYTRADKGDITTGVEPLGELTFLKRGFTPHPKHSKFMLAPIDKSTIYRMLDWIRKSRDPKELLIDNVKDALGFAYHWNVDFYNDFKSKVDNALRHRRIPVVSLSWQDHDDLFVSKFRN